MRPAPGTFLCFGSYFCSGLDDIGRTALAAISNDSWCGRSVGRLPLTVFDLIWFTRVDSEAFAAPFESHA